MSENYPTLGEFEHPIDGKPLILRQLPNGGWVVSQQSGDYAREPRELGAFRHARDMLDALTNILATEDAA